MMDSKVRRGSAAATWLLALHASACAVEVQDGGNEAEEKREGGEVGETSASLEEAFGDWVPAIEFGTGADLEAPEGFLAVHASYQRNNMILAVGGSNWNCCYDDGRNNTRLYAISSMGDLWGSKMQGNTPYPSTADPFCSGHAHDWMGRVVFAGGLHSYQMNGTGIGNTARYESGTVFTTLQSTSPHYYPTLVAGVRHMFLFPGQDTGGDARIKRFSYSGTSWADTGTNQATMSTYPRVHLLPNGKFFVASPDVLNRYNMMYDPVTSTLNTTGAGTDVAPLEDIIGGVGIYDDFRGTSVLLPLTPDLGGYPHPKVAIFNGTKAYSKTFSGSPPSWVQLSARPSEVASKVRRYGNSTLLPTGQVLISGGINAQNSDSGAVLEAEVYDPESNSWLVTNPASTPRNYHSVALLVADGRVWTASSSINKSGSFCTNNQCDPSKEDHTQRAVEYFEPWYVGRNDRPVITSCPANISTDGSVFKFNVGNNQGTNVARVALMRAGSATHSFDTDQRLIWLDVGAKTGSTVSVWSPYGAAAAPPGDYMLFALRDLGASAGLMRYVPSVACWTRVEPQRSIYRVASANLTSTLQSAEAAGFRPIIIDGYTEVASVFYNVAFTQDPGVSDSWVFHKTNSEIQTEILSRFFAGYRMTYLDSYAVNGEIRHNAIFEATPGPQWDGYIAVTEATHNTMVTNFKDEGYRPVSVSVSKVGGVRYYSALWDKANVGDWRLRTIHTEAQYETFYANEVAAGRRPGYVNAWMDGSTPRIVSISNQELVGTARSRSGMTSSQYNAEHNWRLSDGQQLRSIAGYESGGIARWIALWSTH